MKNLFILLAALLSASCIQLPNTGNGNTATRVKAKVIRITCATTVIEVLDAAHFDLGETWTKQGTSETYEHVAVVSNKCEFPATLKEGDEFYFRQINKNDARNDCAVCMMYDFPPSKGIYLQVVN